MAFGNYFSITPYFELTWCASTFFMYSETKFQLDPTNDIEFPDRTPLSKSITFSNIMYLHRNVAKSERVTMTCKNSPHSKDMSAKIQKNVMGFYG